jgi:3-methyl-2-oxobutanoate hydroxymethyltransferase
MDLIRRLTEIGIPVMGHIGLTPQSVHQQGGYYTHGKDMVSASKLIQNAKELEKAGVFSLVLECVQDEVAAQISEELNIPTIGIGAGPNVDGHVLVINDLLKMGPGRTPKFCQPVANLYELKKEHIEKYLEDNSSIILHSTELAEQGPYAQ